MSFEKFAEMTKGDPAVTAAQADRRAASARKPFHDLFLSDVYPSWQGPMTRMSKKAGVASVTHGVAQTFPAAVNAKDLQNALSAPRFVVLAEHLVVETHANVGAAVVYVFAGSESDAVAARLAGFRDGTELHLVDEDTERFAGTIAAVMAAVEADCEAAAELFGPLLVQGHEHRTARIAAEKDAAEKAEADKLAAEAAEAAKLQALKDAEVERQAQAEIERKAAEAPETDPEA